MRKFNYNIKDFRVQLKDLSDDGESVKVDVSYDPDEGLITLITPYGLETDDPIYIDELSSYDRTLVCKHLIIQLAADKAEKDRDYKSEAEMLDDLGVNKHE